MRRFLIFSSLFPPLALVVYLFNDPLFLRSIEIGLLLWMLGCSYPIALIPAWVTGRRRRCPFRKSLIPSARRVRYDSIDHGRACRALFPPARRDADVWIDGRNSGGRVLAAVDTNDKGLEGRYARKE